MNLSRQWPGWVVLFCVGLAPAVDAVSFAVEYPLAQPVPAPPSQRADPVRPPPATNGQSLLSKLSDALGGVENPNIRNGNLIIRNDDPNIRNLEAQFRPHFQQLLYVELAVLRRVCNVDAKAFADVAKGTKPGLGVMVREYALWQRQRNRNVADTIDPRSQVQRLLAPLVEAKLGPEQAQRYRQECDKRAESCKRAVVLNVVAALDERLLLTAEQRAKLVQSLSSEYQSGWDGWLQMITFSVPAFPSVRNELILPILNEGQKSVWQQAPKQNLDAMWGLQFARAGVRAEAAEIQEIARIVEEARDDQ